MHIFVSCAFALRESSGCSIGHKRKALQVVSNRRQHTAHRALCTVWTTGWYHLIANSEYSTCLSVFWRNKRDGGNSCEGRERGVHRTSHRGCVSPAQLIVYTFIRTNMCVTWTEWRQWPNSYPLLVSLLCSRSVFTARMPDCWSCEGKHRKICTEYILHRAVHTCAQLKSFEITKADVLLWQKHKMYM